MTTPLRMTVTARGLLAPGEFRQWEREWKEKQRKAVAGGMGEWGRMTARKLGASAALAFRLSGQKIPKSMKHRVYAAKPERMPAVLLYSKIPWLGMHTEGGTVTAKGGGLLIPLLTKRMGRKAFKRIVDTVLRTGAGYFKKVGSNVILFAEYQPEYGRPLARFRREYRTATGEKRVKAGTDIPIAVLVKSITLKKRLDFDGIVRRELDALAAAIESRLEI